MADLRLASLCLALCASSTTATALDCLAPDPRHILASGTAEPLVLIGSFDFRGDPLPLRIVGSAHRVAFFDGQVLTREGDTEVQGWPVQITADCEIWSCNAPLQGWPVMALATGAPDGDLVLELGPCEMTLFGAPSEAELEPILTCLQGGSCQVDQ